MAVVVLKAGLAEGTIAIIPTIEGFLRDAQFIRGPLDAEIGLFDRACDLKLFRCGIPHFCSPPSPIMIF
jgi:hypothetical protein